nr:hypothetical protein CcurKRNrm2_p032 [Cryptomonas curvata]
MLRIIYTEDKIRNIITKICQDDFYKKKRKKIFLLKNYFFSFFFWLIIYQSFIFWVKTNYNKKKLKFDRFNKLGKKTNIYNKTFETFFINLILKNNQNRKISTNFLIFIDFCKICKKYLNFLKFYFLFKYKNKNIQVKNFKLKQEERRLSNYVKKNFKFYGEYKEMMAQKNILFSNDIKIINLYLKEKILKSNYLLSYNLIEQKNNIEQIYDHSLESTYIFSKVKNKINHNSKNFNKNKKIKFVILICWACFLFSRIILN